MNLTKKQKNSILSQIETIEFDQNGYKQMACPPQLTIRNIKVNKKEIQADVIIEFLEDGRIERYNQCKYPIDIFKDI